jgi:hypothetical protein
MEKSISCSWTGAGSARLFAWFPWTTLRSFCTCGGSRSCPCSEWGKLLTRYDQIGITYKQTHVQLSYRNIWTDLRERVKMKIRAVIAFLGDIGKLFVDIISWPKHLFTVIKEEYTARKPKSNIRSRRPSYLRVVRNPKTKSPASE